MVISLTWRKFYSEDPTDGIYLSEINRFKEIGNDNSIQINIIRIQPIRALKIIYHSRYDNKPNVFEKWVDYARHNYWNFEGSVLSGEEYFEELKLALKSRERIVPLIVFFHHFNNKNEVNEGRHRATAALDLGIKFIPVVDINKNYW